MKVKDLMLPIKQFPVVDSKTILKEALVDMGEKNIGLICIVDNLWAITKTVRLCIACLRPFWTDSSASASKAQVASSSNNIVGLVLLNVFTEEGIGAGSNFTVCKRLRDLYNRITVSDVIFDAVVGPEILSQPPEGKFVTQLRITFETYEEL